MNRNYLYQYKNIFTLVLIIVIKFTLRLLAFIHNLGFTYNYDFGKIALLQKIIGDFMDNIKNYVLKKISYFLELLPFIAFFSFLFIFQSGESF